MIPASHSPLVSVIVPCYNSASYLGETLESVRAQTYPHWECLVVDNGSTDASRSIVEQFAGQDHRFILVAHEVNIGPSAARNIGIAKSTGELVMFLDADDLLYPRKIELQIKAVQEHRVSIVLCNGWRFTHRETFTELHELPVPQPYRPGYIFARAMYRRLFMANQMPIHAVLMRRSLLEELGGFRTEYNHHEDHDLWLRIARAGYDFYALPERLVLYRVLQQSNSSSSARMREGEIAAFHENFDESLISRRILRVRDRHQYKWLLRFLIEERRFNDAKHYLKEYFQQCVDGSCAYWLRGISFWIRIYLTRR